MLKRLMFCKLAILLSAFCPLPLLAAVANWQLNMYRGVTPISRDIYYLHMVCLTVCAIIGVVVFGVMFYALLHHRKSKGYKAANFEGNSRLEIVWSIIPFLILVGLAIPATRVLVRMNDTERSQLTIKIVGYQWRWQYQYLDQGISFFSSLSTPYAQIQNEQKKNKWYLLEVDKPLILPVNQKVRFLVTANDVIHSWWVPELGIKRDAIPGFIYETWAKIERPGTYRGQCAELCGINHGFMPIVVKAVSQEEFDRWLRQQPKVADSYDKKKGGSCELNPMPYNELMILGKMKYDQLCVACHKADGTGLPPLYPGLKNSSVAVGKPIARHIEIILNGVPGSAMQPYKDQLSDTEIAAITTYERNALDNNTDDIIQPAEVCNERYRANKQPTKVTKARAGGLQ